MAKKSKKNGIPDVDGVADDSRRGHAGEAEPPPAISASELKALFRTYDKANADVEKARKDLDAALLVRSGVVAQIADGAGRGPFGYRGQVMTVVCRESKSTGDKTWFFKGPSKSDLTEVG